MSQAVVADAGLLMALAKLNLLHLLKQLYERVQFPHLVYEEVVVEGIQRGFEDASTLQLFLRREGWKPTEVRDMLDDLASSRLDRGERESIALALALDGLLLIDEERGRKEARRQEVTVRGTLGVLIQAYHCPIGQPVPPRREVVGRGGRRSVHAGPQLRLRSGADGRAGRRDRPPPLASGLLRPAR